MDFVSFTIMLWTLVLWTVDVKAHTSVRKQWNRRRQRRWGLILKWTLANTSMGFVNDSVLWNCSAAAGTEVNYTIPPVGGIYLLLLLQLLVHYYNSHHPRRAIMEPVSPSQCTLCNLDAIIRSKPRQYTVLPAAALSEKACLLVSPPQTPPSHLQHHHHHHPSKYSMYS